MDINYLDLFIPDRIRVIKEDKNNVHIYELLAKHYSTTVDDLKTRYDISIQVIRCEITIRGNLKNIAELFEYLSGFDIKFISITQTCLVIQIDDFIRKIY